jgi:hypothetical protein
MNENIASMIGVALVIIVLISWIGFNAYNSISNGHDAEIKKLSLSADQLCALQPITNQTEFCRDRINFFNKDNPVK